MPSAPDLLVRCHACDRLDTVPVAELDLGCRYCGTWPDGWRGTATIEPPTRTGRRLRTAATPQRRAA